MFYQNFIGFSQVHQLAAMAVSAFSKVGDIDDDDEPLIVTEVLAVVLKELPFSMEFPGSLNRW